MLWHVHSTRHELNVYVRDSACKLREKGSPVGVQKD